MLRRNNHIGSAKQSVRPGGINGQRIAGSGAKIHLRTGGTSNPVDLRGLDPVDIIDFFQIIDQPLRIGGNLQHPLALDLMDNFRSTAFAHAADHLFIGQYTFAGCTPVNGHLFFIGQALFKQLQEDPLGPFVIVGIGRVDFPVPVKRKAQAFQLAFEPIDILLGHDLRMNMIFNGKILSRKAECVPSHGIQNIVALHPPFSGNNIQRRIGAGMPYMQAFAGRIRKLHQRIILGLGVVICGGKDVFGVPDILPFFFDLRKIIIHCKPS